MINYHNFFRVHLSIFKLESLNLFSISFLSPLYQGKYPLSYYFLYLSSLFPYCIQKALTSVHFSWSVGPKNPRSLQFMASILGESNPFNYFHSDFFSENVVTFFTSTLFVFFLWNEKPSYLYARQGSKK